MINSKTHKSCTELMKPASPTDEKSVPDSKKTLPPPPPPPPSPSPSLSWDFDQYQNSLNLTPSSLSFPTLKFEVDDGDVAIQSPADSSLWESLSSDLLDGGDFMISSPPVRNMNIASPPQASNFNYYNSTQASLMSSSTQKGKGLSPLHMVFNSPNNYQYMQPESLSLPALENFVDDNNNQRDKDDDLIAYSGIKKSSGVGSESDDRSECFDTLAKVPLLECLTLPNNCSSSSSSRSCGSVINENSVPGAGGSQLIQENDVYEVGSLEIAPLLRQLQQERKLEKAATTTTTTARATTNINRSMLVSPPPPPPPHIGTDEHEQDGGLLLVHLLLACAEAIYKKNYMSARRCLHHLNRVVSTLGDSMQRVASCFTEALSEKLAANLTPPPPPTTTSSSSTTTTTFFTLFPSNSLQILKIYQILYQACPYIKFAHFTANQAIFEAFEAEERVHVIDLDIVQGYQWPAFMQALATRSGGPPFLRITGIGPVPDIVTETGRCLTELAHSLHLPFEFHSVTEQLEDLKPHMFNCRVGEALAVNSVNCLHRIPSKSLRNLLVMIRDQAPNIVTIVEREANHNGTYLGRFLEALHYYSAVFDSLDATFPAQSVQRAKVEQYIFAPEILNIVAREEPERVTRQERLEKWRKIMEGIGFRGVPLSGNAVTQSEILVGLYSCDGYRLREDNGCLLLGWQDRAILTASAWQCELSLASLSITTSYIV